MKYSRLIAHLFALLALASCTLPTREKEPNDSISNATPLSRGQTAAASLSSTADVDVFHIRPSRSTNDVWRFELKSPAPSGFAMLIFDADGPIKNSDRPGPDGKTTLLPFRIKSDLYVGISRLPGTTNGQPSEYTLSCVKEGSVPDTESEPNDAMSSADPMPDHGSVKGYYCPDDGVAEEDWFRFETAEEGLSVRVDLTSVPGIDPVLEIYDASGTLLESADERSTNEGETLANVGLRAAGPYFIRVRQTSGGQNDAVPYRLVLRFDPAGSRNEIENNDNFRNANTLVPGKPVNGFIDRPGDADWYSLEPPAHPQDSISCADISVTGVEKADLVLNLFNAKMEPLCEANNAGLSGPESLKSLRFDGPLYLRISSAEGANPEQNYTLSLRAYPAKPNQETEPNDEIPDNIDPDRSVTGSASGPGDRDLFLFTARKAGQYKVELSKEDGRSQFSLSLYKADSRGRPGTRLMPVDSGYRLQRGKYIVRIDSAAFIPSAFYNFRILAIPKK